ncbi:unnamed protein product [Staurois parvus]|uniref:Uncharacterized protein n=1 Tax=Staurois parvus TaxID=386267 RepID=A0ABN9HJR1_9NEOB|nr:unnamed protein product [Staurois parvus]
MVPGALYHSLFLYLSTEVMFGNEREKSWCSQFFYKSIQQFNKNLHSQKGCLHRHQYNSIKQQMV